MRFYYSRSLFFGICLGIYYGEKRLPFPIQYIPKPDDVIGNIMFDLSIINSIVYDISKLGKTKWYLLFVYLFKSFIAIKSKYVKD